MKLPVKHLPYCRKSGVSCLVMHSDGVCPDVRDCEACKADKLKQIAEDTYYSIYSYLDDKIDSSDARAIQEAILDAMIKAINLTN